MGKSRIFIEGNNFQRRAYLGWQDQNLALYGVRMGYKEAADCLVEEALSQGSKNNIRILDTYIFPIIFLYRHSIEVSIKGIYYRFFGEIPKGGHDLVILWDNVLERVIKIIQTSEFIENVKTYKKHFIRYSFSDINFKEIRDMLAEFNKINDDKADVFRYLLDKKGELYFTESKFIDYDNLKEKINYIYEVLDYIYEAVDDYLTA